MCTFGGHLEFLHDNTSINTFCAYPIVFFHTKHTSVDIKHLLLACWKNSMQFLQDFTFGHGGHLIGNFIFWSFLHRNCW